MLTEFYNTLRELPQDDCDTIALSEMLNDGHAIVLAAKVRQGLFGTQTQLKYVFRVEKGILHTYKLFGSTEDQIRLSLCCLSEMEPGKFQVYFDAYLSEKTSYLYQCDESYLDKAEIRACIPGMPDTLPMTPEIKDHVYKQFEEVRDNGFLYLETPY